MEECVFCQIVQGKIPCYKVWEDEHFLAFLEIKPLSVGHTLLIPKKHFRWVWDLPENQSVFPNYSLYFEKAKKVKELLVQKLNSDWVELRVMGMKVSHCHIHLIPHSQNQERESLSLPQVANLLV